MNIIIDPEFAAQIPPPTDVEKQQLRENLRRDGCREKLIAWRRDNGAILLDGHTRKSICDELRIPYAFTVIDLPDRIAAADWIDHNQIGRRNLTPDQMSLLRS